MASFVPFLPLPITGQGSIREMLRRVLYTVLNETPSSAKGLPITHKGLGAADCCAQSLASPRRWVAWEPTGEPLESQVWPFGEEHCSEQGWGESNVSGGGRNGSDSKQEGPLGRWVCGSSKGHHSPGRRGGK